MSASFLKKRSKKLLLCRGVGVGGSRGTRLGLGLLLAGLTLMGCSKPVPVQHFSGSGNFNPLAFFTGHVTSWGVTENQDGAPTGIITTDCEGVVEGPSRLRMVQVLHREGAPADTRIWQMTQTGPESFTATANDMDGSAAGADAGRAFQWHWVLENAPGNAIENVTMTQWMYQMDANTLMIRSRVSKLGVTIMQVSELFRKD